MFRPCVPKTRKGRRGNAPTIWSWPGGARQLRFWSPSPIQDRRANSWRAFSCYCIICAGCRDIETKPLSFRWLEYGRWVAVLRLPPLWSWKSLKSFWQQQPWRFRQSPKKLSLMPRQLGQAEKPCDVPRCLLSHRSAYWCIRHVCIYQYTRAPSGRRRGRERESARERERWRYTVDARPAGGGEGGSYTTFHSLTSLLIYVLTRAETETEKQRLRMR